MCHTTVNLYIYMRLHRQLVNISCNPIDPRIHTHVCLLVNKFVMASTLVESKNVSATRTQLSEGETEGR